MSTLVVLGVENPEDVYILNESDLRPELTVIQARRLIMQWSKEKAAA